MTTLRSHCHTKLGVFGTGCRPKTVVWIAETIQPDHRAAIDWLNTNTTEEFSFFGIEIELWRIGNSPPAPRFNVIASPNDWTRKTRTGVRNIEEGVEAERHRVRLAYWASFAEYLKEKGSTFRIRRANRDYWFSFGIGGRGFHLNATISADKQRVGVELYAPNDVDKTAFHALYAQKDAIEKEFGEPLEWMELPGKKATRIVMYKTGVDPSDPKQYPELHAWMLEKMDRFKSVFTPRIKSLVLTSPTDPEETEEVPEKAAIG